MSSWIDNYSKMLFPIDSDYIGLRGFYRKKTFGNEQQKPSMSDLQVAHKYKIQNLPKKLYKYRNFDKEGYSINSLIGNTLWLSKPFNFNDPFDSVPHSHSIQFFEDNYRLALDFDGKFNPKKSDKTKSKSFNIDHFINSNSIFKKLYDLALIYNHNLNCNSRNKDLNIVKKDILNYLNENVTKSDWDSFMKISKYNYSKIEIHIAKNEKIANSIKIGCLSSSNKSVLMWSHYSLNHTGFCIEYNLENLSNSDIFFQYIYPVIYKDLSNEDNEAALSGIKYYNLYSVLRKSTKWKYEEEYRVILSNDYSGNKFLMPSISAIYIGCKASVGDTNLLLDIAKKNNIIVYKAKMKYNSQELEFRKCV